MSDAPHHGLHSLALLGNCQIAMLVAANCGISFGCWPRLDSEPLFAQLLDDGAPETAQGRFLIEMPSHQRSSIRYRRNTAIVETILEDAAGNIVQITDFAPRFRRFGRVFRPAMLVRIVTPIAGRPVIRIELQPGIQKGARSNTQVGSHHLRYLAPGFGVRLTTDASLAFVNESRPFVLDRPLHLILGPDETLDREPAVLARDYELQTENYWQEWVRSLAIPAQWQEAVIRAAITLKLCAYEDTGAIVAAPTTSIPEAKDSRRNWDYRYCWLRDSYFVVQALNRLGATRTMEAYLNFIDGIATSSEGRPLQPVYGISGAHELPEQEIKLRGYRGMGPVRVGNLAYQQIQNDVYGSVVLSATQAFFDERLTNPGDASRFARLESLGHKAYEVYALPDAGIWEYRGILKRHTHSAAICWSASDRLARIARRLQLPERVKFWNSRAKTMADTILAASWRDTQGYLSADLDSPSLDASLLQLPEIGLIGWKDPRFLATMDAIEHNLMQGQFLMRYRHTDDFGEPQNAFLACSFWWVNALAATGRITEARELFESLLAARSSTGLLAEHIDTETSELWGNFPQTYSMVGIITAAIRLSSPWEEML